MKSKAYYFIALFIIVTNVAKSNIGLNLSKLALFAKDSLTTDSSVTVYGQVHANGHLNGNFIENTDSIYSISDSLVEVEMNTLYDSLTLLPFDTIVLSDFDTLQPGNYFITSNSLPQGIVLSGSSVSKYVFHFQNDLILDQSNNLINNNILPGNVIWIVEGVIQIDHAAYPGIFISQNSINITNGNFSESAFVSFKNINLNGIDNSIYFSSEIELLRIQVCNYVPGICTATVDPCDFVINEGFEINLSMACHSEQFESVCNWYNPSIGHIATPDYYTIGAPSPAAYGYKSVSIPSNDMGIQTCRLTGTQSYAGIGVYNLGVPNYREYIEQQLSQPLTPGIYACVFFASLADRCEYEIDQLGAYFSTGPVVQTGSNPILITPQVSSNNFLSNCSGWTPISGLFYASGGEDHITIGNFQDDATMNHQSSACTNVRTYIPYSYYYIDNVSLKKFPEATPLSYTTLCGTSIPIGPILDPCIANLPDIVYTWSPATGLSGINLLNPDFNLSVPGTYTYNLHIYYLGIILDFPVTVTVTSLQPTITANRPYLNCVPNSVTLTALPAGASYLWTPTGGTGQTMTTSTAGTYQVEVTQNGCSGTATYVVSNPPAINIGISNPSPLACYQQQVTLSTTCPTCVSYSWSPGGSTSSQISVTATSAANFTVTGTDAYGCTGTATTSIAVPIIPVPIISGSTSHCGTDVVTLTVSNWNSAYSNLYTWSVNPSSATISPNANSQTITIGFASNLGGIVTLTYGLPGCQSSVNYYIQDCCLSGSGGPSLHDGSTPNDITVQNTTSTPNITFNGLFTVDRDFSFVGCNDMLFAPGSRILVKTGKTLTIDNSTLRPSSECCFMWRGIDLEAGAHIVFLNSSITQAEYAITIRNNGSYKIIDSHFRDNYVGLNLKSDFGTASIQGILETTEFYADYYSCTLTPGTGNFLQPYLGQVTIVGLRPLCGVLANNINTTLIGNNLPTPNGNIHFYNLSNGIISNNVNILNVRNSTFVDMIPDLTYQPIVGSANGCGIRGNKGYVDFQGLGGQFPASPFSLKNCIFGAHLTAVTGKIHDNSSDFDVRTGFFLAQCNKLGVEKNSICAMLNGIRTFNTPNNGSIVISANEMRMKTFGTMTGGNILLQENGFPTRIKILDNHLFVNKGIYGIRSMNSSGTLVQHNWIEMTNQFNYSGIDIQRGDKNSILCNTVTGVLNNAAFQNAIQLSQSLNPIVGGNYVDEQRIGIRFNGACGVSVCELNQFYDHYIGLGFYYGPNIGQQLNKGNKWFGNCTYGAFLSGLSVQNMNNNRFFYSSLSSQNFPVGSISGTNDPSNYWFTSNGNLDLDLSLYTCAPYVPPAPEGLPIDYIIATDQLDPNSEFPEQNYSSTRYLFEKLKNDPSLLLADPILTAFYNQQFNGRVGKFGSVAVDLNNALKWQSVYYDVYETNLILLEQKSDSLIFLTEELDLDPSNQSIMDAIDLLNSQIIVITESNQNIELVTSQFKEAILTNIENENSSLIDEEVYESNEVTVNSIYLNTIAHDNFNLNADEILQLEGIIYQCPFSGGPSVYTARVLYSMHIENVDYDDDDLCILQGVPPRMKKDEDYTSSLLYPNPAKNQSTLKYNLGAKQKGIFKLVNSLGISVYERNLVNSESELTIDCSNFQSGVYFYKVIVDDVEKNAGLFSVIK